MSRAPLVVVAVATRPSFSCITPRQWRVLQEGSHTVGEKHSFLRPARVLDLDVGTADDVLQVLTGGIRLKLMLVSPSMCVLRTC